MFYFIKGKVEFLKSDSIILSNNDIGYQIYVSHVDHYKVGQVVTIYIFNVVKEDANYLIGFDTVEEKQLFLSLIKVNGVGPKTAVSALRVTSPEELKKAIECGNVSFLRKLPGIGDKAAYQIILDMRGKLNLSQKNENPKVYQDAEAALIQLGFKKAQIQKVLSDINETNIELEELIKLALLKLKK